MAFREHAIMKLLCCLGLVILLCSPPVIATDTSNWVNVSSDAGISFEMPPYWAWDPAGETKIWIRSERSDAVLVISYNSLDPLIVPVSDSDLIQRTEETMADLHVVERGNVTPGERQVTATGITLDGTIVNYTEFFDTNHSIRWISEYADSDAVVKYSDTIQRIINSTEVSVPSL